MANCDPEGVFNINNSALVSFNTDKTSTGFSLLMITTSSVYSDKPSSKGPIITLTPNEFTSITFSLLFGAAKIASDRSLFTFLSSTSKAATISISEILKPPKFG